MELYLELLVHACAMVFVFMKLHQCVQVACGEAETEGILSIMPAG